MYSLLIQTRKERGLTQKQVALKANISFRAYQNYELGTRKPNVDIAIAIAKALNSDVATLFNTHDCTTEK